MQEILKDRIAKNKANWLAMQSGKRVNWDQQEKGDKDENTDDQMADSCEIGDGEEESSEGGETVIISATSAAKDNGSTALITINGEAVEMSCNEGGHYRGLHVVLFNPFNGYVEWAKVYDTYKRPEFFDLFVDSEMPEGWIVVAACKDECSTHLSREGKQFFSDMGSREIWKLGYRQGFAFIGQIGRKSEDPIEKRALSKTEEVSVTQIFQIHGEAVLEDAPVTEGAVPEAAQEAPGEAEMPRKEGVQHSGTRTSTTTPTPVPARTSSSTGIEDPLATNPPSAAGSTDPAKTTSGPNTQPVADKSVDNLKPAAKGPHDKEIKRMAVQIKSLENRLFKRAMK